MPPHTDADRTISKARSWEAATATEFRKASSFCHSLIITRVHYQHYSAHDARLGCCCKILAWLQPNRVDLRRPSCTCTSTFLMSVPISHVTNRVLRCVNLGTALPQGHGQHHMKYVHMRKSRKRFQSSTCTVASTSAASVNCALEAFRVLRRRDEVDGVRLMQVWDVYHRAVG